jgi:hypothetical protein
VSDRRLQLKATRILHRNNAQEIRKALADLEEHRSEFATRWLWELIQNARDFPDQSRLMTIRATVSPTQITFAHNGRDFTEEEILSLVLHRELRRTSTPLPSVAAWNFELASREFAMCFTTPQQKPLAPRPKRTDSP